MPDRRPERCSPAPSPTLPVWGYHTGLTPERWHTVYPACTEPGSPVDIATGTLGDADPADPVELDLRPTRWRVLNTGRTVQAEPAGPDGGPGPGRAGGFTVATTRYTVAQLHFHAPSEHTFDGAAAAMEIHVVATSADDAVTVIGAPLRIGPGPTALGLVLDAVPSEVTPAPFGRIATGITTGGSVTTDELDLSDVLPVGRDTVRYLGSLTTPPCTGGVLWHVYTTPVTVSADEAAGFTAVHHGNVRPVQPLHDRELSVRTVVNAPA
ncbi:MAG: carbonic anhydrase family protein [Micrococcales bacterium]|nr:carbonic anhydrase family protein [Micrococcales bacterium]